MKAELSTLKILKYRNQSVLMVTGSLLCNPGHIELSIEANGRKYDTKALIWPEESGEGPVKHLFELEQMNLPENIKEIRITAAAENKSDELFHLDQEFIQNHAVQSSVMYHIDSVEYSENQIVTVNGWAVSLTGMPVNISVVKENGQSCDSTFHRTLRQRLVERDIVDPDHMFCGFALSFAGEAQKKYQICFQDDSSHIYASVSTDTAIGTSERVRQLFHKINRKNFKRAFDFLKKNGIRKFFKRLRYPIADLPDYNAWFLRNRVSREEIEKQKKTDFDYAPEISILVPVFNTPEKLLREMFESVRAQSYGKWQLCIADASAEGSTASDIVDEYSEKDPRITCVHLHANYGISDNTNKALELADGEYIALFDHDDLLEPDCLFEIVKSLQNHRYEILYTDEDKLNDETGEYEEPNFKPDYNPDLLLSHNYITHFFVVSHQIMNQTGGFRKRYDGSQDYDVILRCIEKSKDIHHIPKSLYHWRMHKGSTASDPKSKMYCYVAGENALNDHLRRAGIRAQAKMMPEPFWGIYHTIYETPGDPLVSIIIPNYDHADILKNCVDSLLEKNEYKNIEIIIVENNSKEKETFQLYESLQREHENIHVVEWKGKEFNFSRINNFGVSCAKGDYLLFLNNDTEVIEPKSVREMLGLCMRKDVGCVGAKLLYADNTIQHAGIVLGFSGYAQHVYTQTRSDEAGFDAAEAVCNVDYSAVTAACMMTKKTVYHQIGGMDERFKVAANDVDYCLKAGQAGYRVVYNAHALWHHYESKSRGYENNISKIRRFDHEVTLFQQKWKQVLINGDPNYNPNYKIEDAPFEIR